jgi:8-oxo-dGTP pyrophosphatase MutT (NUDIX family)
VDPAADVSVLVWRRKYAGDELLEVTDTGREWRLPRRTEIGLRCSLIEGEIGALAEAAGDFDPGRLHRWVRIGEQDERVRLAFAQSGASAIIWRRGASGPEVLLLHRFVNGTDDEGDWAWCPPGGALDPGETHLECAERELLEETGLDVPLVRLHGIDRGFAAHLGELTESDAVVVLSEEHDRFEWVGIDDAIARCLPDVVAGTLRVAKRNMS